MTVTAATPLAEVIGKQAAGSMSRGLSLKTVGDAIAHYPRRYLTAGEQTPIAELREGEHAAIVADVEDAKIRYSRAGRELLEVTVGDGDRSVSLTFFGGQGRGNYRPQTLAWRLQELRPGRRGVFTGQVGRFNESFQFAHPHYEMFDDEAEARAEAFLKRPIPVYPATQSFSTMKVRAAIGKVLDKLGTLPDAVPEEFRDANKLLRLRLAIERIHRPTEENDWRVAQHTLRAHEALVTQVALMQQRQLIRRSRAQPREARSDAMLAQFDSHNPFELTPDQVSVGAAIQRDLEGESPMSRLVQGEVGSGKTLVALRAMLQVADSGGQAALIAPTEVLAAQHLRSITKMLGPELAPKLAPVLLTGQMPAAARKRAALAAASGQALIVIGTHALFSDKTTFADLGLVVVDEQHRFGVEQREMLRTKGSSPHTLVLTATPIPRTVAMTVFGDLDISTIRTMPAGRAGIETHVAPIGEKPGWFARVWERAAEEVALGRQVFVVCPAIDAADADADRAEDEADGPAAGEESVRGPQWGVKQALDLVERHPQLSMLRSAGLHGRMSGEDKDRVMQAFARGEIDILVATTVVEVGVDVPNASTMIVLEADRFGVSQLHQLRGRVGRGAIPGLCLLVTETLSGTFARERVDAVAATLDGFELAEVDLTQRGEGDVLGDAQSGVRSSLKLLRVMKDKNLILAARAAAEDIVAADADLVSHPHLAAAIGLRLTGSARAAMAKS